MAENLKYLSTVPAETAAGQDAGEVMPLVAPVDVEREVTYSIPVGESGQSFATPHSIPADHSKTVALGALILSLALLLLLAGLIVRRRMRGAQEQEPDLVELDKLNLRSISERDRGETPVTVTGGDVPPMPRRPVSPVVAFGEDDADAANSSELEAGDGVPEAGQNPKKTISVKAPPKPKRRF